VVFFVFHFICNTLCKTTSIIYLLQCKLSHCSMQYIGNHSTNVWLSRWMHTGLKKWEGRSWKVSDRMKTFSPFRIKFLSLSKYNALNAYLGQFALMTRCKTNIFFENGKLREKTYDYNIIDCQKYLANKWCKLILPSYICCTKYLLFIYCFHCACFYYFLRFCCVKHTL